MKLLYTSKGLRGSYTPLREIRVTPATYSENNYVQMGFQEITYTRYMSYHDQSTLVAKTHWIWFKSYYKNDQKISAEEYSSYVQID